MLTLNQHLSTTRTTEIGNLSSYFKPCKPVLGDFVSSDKEKSDTFEMLLYNCTVGTCIELVKLTIEIGVNMITKSKQANLNLCSQFDTFMRGQTDVQIYASTICLE